MEDKKMKYYKLLYDHKNDIDFIGCLSDELYGVDQYDVEQGESISHWDERITLVYNPNEGNRATDYLANDLGWLVVSSKLKKILEEADITGIQYLPINVKNKLDNQELEGYLVANICNIVDALDFENSKYDLFDIDENEKMLAVEKYVLKKDRVKDVNIFKIGEDNIPNFVSEKFKKIIEANNLTGFDFLEVKVV